MEKNLIIIYSLIQFFLLNIQFCLSQSSHINRTNHWYFGQNAGLDFTSGTAVADTSGKMTVLQGCATMSDTAGNLLFYTDGKTAWNALHDTLFNGSGLGVGLYGTPLQGVLIIPQPGANNIYYIFTVDGWEHFFLNGLRYSIVDMNLDSGKGSVTQKNILLCAPTCEALGSVSDATGCGYWLVTHERYTDIFRAYHITYAGIDTSAVISAIGPNCGFMANMNQYCGIYGINFSSNGNLFASIDFWGWLNGTGIPDTLSIYQFNKNTGIVSNRIALEVDTLLTTIGISPDNSKLYQASGRFLFKMYQYDISNYSINSIQTSKMLIFSSNPDLPSDLRQGLDGMLYGSMETKQYLCAIQNPNASGLACNYVVNNTSLGGKSALMELPNFVRSFYDSSNACIASVVEIENHQIQIFPNPAMDWIEIRGDDFERVQLVDITGRIVFSSSNKTISSEQRINLSAFSRGIYIISLSSKQKSINQKIILQ